VLQYIISVLLQLNIESSNAQLDDTINSPQHQHNRTLLRGNLLGILSSSIQLTSLQLVQQMAFALHLITVSTFFLLSSTMACYIQERSPQKLKTYMLITIMC